MHRDLQAWADCLQARQDAHIRTQVRSKVVIMQSWGQFKRTNSKPATVQAMVVDSVCLS